jgi:60 kDa SS-A/Ro ribonucleoprotein
MSNYLTKIGVWTRKTPQTEAIPGREREMTRNNAGGVAFTAEAWIRLERWLLLGSEGGSYYVSENDLTKQNVANVRAAIAEDGEHAVKMIVDISVAGRAPKNDPALYALALAASRADAKTRERALAALPQVARTGTHLFQFVSFIDGMRGWGPALRKAVAQWYTAKTPVDRLGYQLVKYQQRGGWSHRDLFRLAHVPMDHAVARWIIGADNGEHTVKRYAGKRLLREDRYPALNSELPAIMQAFEQAKQAEEATVIRLVREHGLTREMIPTEHQKSAAVWEALLEKMPLGAILRTLGRMGACGLLTPFSDAAKLVTNKLSDREQLRKARVHPIDVLKALLVYQAGHGDKGSLSWTAVPQVVDALNGSYCQAFQFVPATGKRFFLGIDVSGSMTMGRVAGFAGLTPNMGAAAMAMLIARTEPNHFIGGFATQFVDLKISASDRLDGAMKKCQRNFGGTDTTVAIDYAQKHKYAVDAFVVITDGETWAGDQHTSQALESYRRKMGLDTKLIVINMVANHTRITDPTDAGSLDIVGFDTSVPTVMHAFLGGSPEFPEEDAA